MCRRNRPVHGDSVARGHPVTSVRIAPPLHRWRCRCRPQRLEVPTVDPGVHHALLEVGGGGVGDAAPPGAGVVLPPVEQDSRERLNLMGHPGYPAVAGLRAGIFACSHHPRITLRPNMRSMDGPGIKAPVARPR